MTTSRFLLVVFLSFGFSAVAAGAKSSGGSSSSGSSGGGTGQALGWAVGGAGNITGIDPKTDMGFENILIGLIGGEFTFVKDGMIGVTLGGYWSTTDGVMNYDYTSAAKVHYAGNFVPFTMDTQGFYAGLKIHFINNPTFRFYGEGGGSLGQATFKYNLKNFTSITAHGSDYSSQDGEVPTSGYYGEAGMEFLPFNGLGVKLGGRYSVLTTDDIPSLQQRKARFEQIFGFFGVAKSF